MSTPVPPPAAVRDNPRRPYKAAAALVVVFVALLWERLSVVHGWGALGFEDWARIVIPTVIATGAVYGVPNPKVLAAGGTRQRGRG